MVWHGRKSSRFFISRTMNAQVYRDECLKKRLLSFINRQGSRPLFWADMASCHYAKDTLPWYKANNINFVTHDCNPSNSPELRPIGEYWSIVKGILKKTVETVKNIEEFKTKWLWASRKVDNALVQNMMARVRRKVRSLAYRDNNN